MRWRIVKAVSTIILGLFAFQSCMVLDGGNSYRKKNKCCGIIKCDIHRRSSRQNHKRSVNASKSYQKKEARIKNKRKITFP